MSRALRHKQAHSGHHHCCTLCNAITCVPTDSVAYAETDAALYLYASSQRLHLTAGLLLRCDPLSLLSCFLLCCSRSLLARLMHMLQSLRLAPSPTHLRPPAIVPSTFWIFLAHLARTPRSAPYLLFARNTRAPDRNVRPPCKPSK